MVWIITLLISAFGVLGSLANDFTAEWISKYADGVETLIPQEFGSIENYQPRMPFLDDTDRTDCPHNLENVRDWNDPLLQWPFRTGTPAADGLNVTLPALTSVIIRVGMLSGTASSPYGQIIVPVGTRLIFDDPGTPGDTIVLHTLGLKVDGALEAGSPTCRLQGKIEITLHETFNAPVDGIDRSLASNMDIKGIVVTNTTGARWDFHGALYHPTWTRLAAHIPGSQGLTGAPEVRNSEIFLQDCVNWPAGGTVVITTSQVKDTRSYNYNEEGTIKADGVRCISIDGRSYGKVTLDEPLVHYHHAGDHEYQCEVFLLTRNIVIQGNARSEPTDVTPLECPSTSAGYTDMPCPGTFLTGFGGHTIVIGQSESRLRGVEFYRMGMTNAVGRYPIHFHYSTTGQLSFVEDCSVHRSYYRAYTIHNTFSLNVTRNIAYDIIGHAFYLESGVEELNRVEYNLAAFVHPIDGAVLMPGGAFEPGSEQTDSISVPADHTASGFYVSNAYNYIIGNAASGGWAGIQFPILPQPVDPFLRFNGVVPKDRPALLISGNSVHSSSWFSINSGAFYSGGSLYFEETDTESRTLKYNAGRVGTNRLTRDTRDEDNSPIWFKVYNSTAWLVNVGATGWGRRSEYHGFEVHDFQKKGIFVLFKVWLDKIILNCRTSNALKVPDPGTKFNENLLNDGNRWSGFFSYDHLMQHILTDWKISNCGGVARGLQPWVHDGKIDKGDAAMFTVPVYGFGPEVQLISSGFLYDWNTLGGRNFTNESIFFSGSGAQNVYSMQYMSNWEDADGSMTQRKSRTVIGPARAGKWWNLDYRHGQCEIRSQWKLPHILCNKKNRHLASMFTVVMPQKTTQGSAVFKMIYRNGENERKIRQGSMTHFGFTGNSSKLTCTPPETCSETTSRSWDPDLTGPFNHAQYGGWYLSFDEGTPAEMTIQRVQIEEGAVMLQAMGLPSTTVVGDIHIWAESYKRTYDFTLASTLDDVRESQKGDLYWFDFQTKTLYWRVIAGYVDNDMSFDWINREEHGQESFTRANLSVANIITKNQFQLHIDILCTTDGDAGDAFCLDKPVFIVPSMGCPEGEVMLSIDECGPSCELENNCERNSTDEPSASPSESPTTLAPTTVAPTTSAPTTEAPTTTAPTTAAPTTTAPTTAAPTTATPTTEAPTTAAPTTATPTTSAPTLPVPITLVPTKGKSKKELIKECKQKVAAIYSKQVKALKKSKAKGVASCKKKHNKKKKKQKCIKDQSNKYKKGLKAKKSVKNRDSKKCNTEFN